MSYQLGIINIQDVAFGSTTEIKDGILTIKKEELVALIKEDERIATVEVEIAKPGERIRIVPVKDVIQPRGKVEGGDGVFPGMVSKVDMAGYGRTHVLEGCAIVTCGNIVGFQEGIIDMSGPGAEYTPFSKNINVVLVCEPIAGLAQHQHEEALRLAGLKAAKYLGAAGKEAQVDQLHEYERIPIPEMLKKYGHLPTVAYVYQLQSQGLLHDTYVYGVDAKKILPTVLHPCEVMDGAIVSGNCVSACDKNTTYHHLNNPVIHDLLEKHGKELNFLGVVITNENVTLKDKERSSNFTAKLVEQLGVEGVIITEEGFGNPDTDLIMNCKKIEKLGIKTVLITDEYAGRDGASQSLADADPLADAVVTAGNANEVVTLPPMDKVIGIVGMADTIAGGFKGSLGDDGSITVELQAITGATNELGFNLLSAKEA
jgi:glycine reductase